MLSVCLSGCQPGSHKSYPLHAEACNLACTDLLMNPDSKATSGRSYPLYPSKSFLRNHPKVDVEFSSQLSFKVHGLLVIFIVRHIAMFTCRVTWPKFQMGIGFGLAHPTWNSFHKMLHFGAFYYVVVCATIFNSLCTQVYTNWRCVNIFFQPRRGPSFISPSDYTSAHHFCHPFIIPSLFRSNPLKGRGVNWLHSAIQV